MHELSLAQSIFEIINQHIKDESVKTVSSIKIKIGRLRQVVPDSLIFCFEAVAKDSKVARAKIIIEDVDILVRCKSCMIDSGITNGIFICDICGSNKVKVIKGNELFIESMEVEYGN